MSTTTDAEARETIREMMTQWTATEAKVRAAMPDAIVKTVTAAKLERMKGDPRYA